MFVGEFHQQMRLKNSTKYVAWHAIVALVGKPCVCAPVTLDGDLDEPCKKLNNHIFEATAKG